jgi:transcriptional regulator with GAF, ATPase, and Fis domain
LRVAQITRDAIPAAEIVGISMLDDRGRPATAVYTDEASPEMDASQYEENRGPCLDAWRQKRVVRIEDIADAADEYPKFSRAAADHGISSTLSLPLVIGDHGLGAMNLYSIRVRAFTPDDETLGYDLATTASVVLSNASAFWQAYELGEHLTEAMKTRGVIEQAKGMLMAQSNLTADEAFGVLCRASQRENVKLRDIARRIVAREPFTAG